MNKILIHPTYFPSISHYAAMVQADQILFEADDHYQKQTNRNRMYIYSANGTQLLNLPIKHTKNTHQKYKDVVLETAFDWQKQHFKSLEAGYRTSPFFEFYEDNIRPIFEKRHHFLFDLNLETHAIVCKALQIDLPYQLTEEYHKETPAVDLRVLANGKKDPHLFTPYTQVFGQKHGYLNNLSILDLLFNEGPQALTYLKEQKISL